MHIAPDPRPTLEIASMPGTDIPDRRIPNDEGQSSQECNSGMDTSIETTMSPAELVPSDANQATSEQQMKPPSQDHPNDQNGLLHIHDAHFAAIDLSSVEPIEPVAGVTLVKPDWTGANVEMRKPSAMSVHAIKGYLRRST